MNATLLTLADGRFPGGGHAHSGGLEAAVECGRVHDLPSLRDFLTLRLRTSGAVAAGLAAAACSRRQTWDELDAEADARMPSPAQRAASRKQGRQLLRAARAAWPSPILDALDSPHHAIALGAVAAVSGLSAVDAALAAAYASVTGPATAAVRLLSLDPIAVNAMIAALAPEIDRIAHTGLADIPSLSAPLTEIEAELHASWEVRLFAS